MNTLFKNIQCQLCEKCLFGPQKVKNWVLRFFGRYCRIRYKENKIQKGKTYKGNRYNLDKIPRD